MISINLTVIFTVFNFILLIFVLKAILFAPMIKYLDERTKKIDDSLKLAEENQKRADDMKIEHDKIIMEARSKASEILDAASTSAAKESREIVSEARKKAQDTVESAKDAILMEAERIKQDLRRDVASMTVSLAGKVLEREIKEDDHKELIKKSLDVMSA